MEEKNKVKGKGFPFKTPEGYYEKLHSEVMSRAVSEGFPRGGEKEHQKVTTSSSFIATIRPYLYMAAMFVGMLLMFNMWHYIISSSNIDSPSHNSVSQTLMSDVGGDFGASPLQEDEHDIYLSELVANSHMASYIIEE